MKASRSENSRKSSSSLRSTGFNTTTGKTTKVNSNFFWTFINTLWANFVYLPWNKKNAPIQKVKQLLHFGILIFFHSYSLFRVNCRTSRKISLLAMSRTATSKQHLHRTREGFLQAHSASSHPWTCQQLSLPQSWPLHCSQQQQQVDAGCPAQPRPLPQILNLNLPTLWKYAIRITHLIMISFHNLANHHRHDNCWHYRLPWPPKQALKWINQYNCQLSASKTTKNKNPPEQHLSHCRLIVFARVRNSLKSTFPSSDLLKAFSAIFTITCSYKSSRWPWIISPLPPEKLDNLERKRTSHLKSSVLVSKKSNNQSECTDYIKNSSPPSPAKCSVPQRRPPTAAPSGTPSSPRLPSFPRQSFLPPSSSSPAAPFWLYQHRGSPVCGGFVCGGCLLFTPVHVLTEVMQGTYLIVVNFGAPPHH